MPQYTLASMSTRYLRSLRVYPLARSCVIVVLMESSPVADSTTLSTTGVHDASVTNRTCRLPPVSDALWSKTASVAAAHWLNDERYVAYRSGRSDARA